MLAAAMLVALLPACSNNGNNEEDKSAPSSDETPEITETVEEEEVISDNLPDMNYEGYTFNIVCYFDDIGFIEEETGEVLNDAIFRRDNAVEDRFNIELVGVESGDSVNDIRICAQAGTQDYDIGLVHMVNGASAASSGIYYPLNKLDYINIDKPWWDSDCLEAFSVGDNMLLLCGMAQPMAMLRSSCLAFNKNQFDNLGMQYPYTYVYEGNWTLDKMYDILKDTNRDLDGDGKFTEDNDFYGFSSWYLDSPYSFYYGAGGTITRKDENNVPYIDMQLEFNAAVYEKIYKIVRGTNSNYHTDSGNYYNAYTTFTNGRVLIVECSLSHFKDDAFRNMEEDYGVLPMPMFDENQEHYYSFVNGCVDMLCVPISVADTDRTGIIIEGIASASYSYIYDALFEVTAKAKSARDEDSTKMMDLIMEYRAFDFAYAHLYSQSITQFVRDLLVADSTDVASTFSKNEKLITKVMDKLVSSYQDYYS